MKQEGEVEAAGVAITWIRQRDASVFVTLAVVGKMVTTADLEATEMDTIDPVNVKNEYLRSKYQATARTLQSERLLNIYVSESLTFLGSLIIIQHIHRIGIGKGGFFYIEGLSIIGNEKCRTRNFL